MKIRKNREDIMGLDSRVSARGVNWRKTNWKYWVRMTNGRNLYLILEMKKVSRHGLACS